VAASKPPLKHRVEQRITASDSTESLIRFCKEIDFATENSGKSNHRNSQNYPTTSGNSGFFTDDYFQRLTLLCRDIREVAFNALGYGIFQQSSNLRIRITD
jgi:hypothetical protein